MQNPSGFDYAKLCSEKRNFTIRYQVSRVQIAEKHDTVLTSLKKRLKIKVLKAERQKVNYSENPKSNQESILLRRVGQPRGPQGGTFPPQSCV